MRRHRGSGPLAFVVMAALTLVMLGGPTTRSAEAEKPSPDRITVSVSARAGIALLSWDAAPGAVSYRLDWNAESEPSGSHTATTTRTMFMIGVLEADTTYEAEVTALAADAVTVVGQGRAVLTTSNPEYPFPALLLATTSPNYTSIAASWPALVGSGASYVAELAEDEAFTDPVRKTTSAPSVRYGHLRASTPYYLRVMAVDSSGAPLTDWSLATVSPSTQQPLRVGSYNIRKAQAADSRANSSPWSVRRTAVAATILGQDPDVVGLQEASWQNVRGSTASQFGDLLSLLGEDWDVTNGRGIDGTQGVRTIYNRTRLTLLGQGFEKLAGSNAYGAYRYVTWAKFRQLSTNKTFLFANVHLVDTKSKKAARARAAEAAQAVRAITRHNRTNLPVVLVGDLNSSKFRKPTNAPYDVITKAGYIDPLDNIDGWTGGARGIAEKRVNADLFTFNDYTRVAPRSGSTGVMVDQIFVTAKTRVSEWETVAKLDASGRFEGVIPSDHNLIRATVYLP